MRDGWSERATRLFERASGTTAMRCELSAGVAPPGQVEAL